MMAAVYVVVVLGIGWSVAAFDALRVGKVRAATL